MLIEKDLIQLPIDVGSTINNLVPLVNSVNWSLAEFDREEQSLKEGRLCLLPYLISKSNQLVPTPSKDILISSLGPIIKILTEYFNDFKIVRGELVNLKSNRSLTPHIDIYWFHKMSRRIHVPITSNSNCMLSFEDREYHLEPGKVYEINNRIMHSGFNNGETDRVHLILDFMPNDVFNNALKTKQNFMEKV